MSDFKQHIKRLIGNSQFKDAATVCDRCVPRLESSLSNSKVNFEDQVTLLHWTTKVHLCAHNLKVLTSDSILRVNTLLNNKATQ